MNVTVIGLGEIGYETFRELIKRKEHTFNGVEVDENRLSFLSENYPSYSFTKEVPYESDMYIISVYSPKQIKSVISQINLERKPLVVIESTMLPGETKKILKEYPNLDLVLFPHRYNPNDPEHHVFNLNRIMGAVSGDALAKAVDFYKDYISMDLLTLVPLAVAELSKPLENAYRYVEIALAEEIKLLCEEKGVDFETLRKAMNTKWNINVKEARRGIGLKCLPKDCKFINDFFVNNNIFTASLRTDALYRGYLNKQGIKTDTFREV